MKKFTIPCDFGGQKAPFTVYIGKPDPDHHPLHFQAEWLSKQRGGIIPAEVMEGLEKLKKIAIANNVSFEELCEYALASALASSGNQVKVEDANKPKAEVEAKPEIDAENKR
jgi:hypothetical protein